MREAAKLERALWSACEAGDQIDAGSVPVPAALVARLALTAHSAKAGRVPAIRIKNAHIVGQLDLADGSLNCPIRFDHCVFDEPPLMTNASTLSVGFYDCKLPELHAGWLRTVGHLEVVRCEIDGQFIVWGSRIQGELILNGSHIGGAAGVALAGSGVRVTNALRGDAGLVIRGEVRINGASFGVMLLQGATLEHADAVALSATDLVVAAGVYLSDGFRAAGVVRLDRATIKGELSLESGTVDELSLVKASVGVLRLSGDSLPDRLVAHGLEYENLLGLGDELGPYVSLLSRMSDGYRAQPYEQLAAWFRRYGDDRRSRQVLLAKQRARRATLGFPGRLWGRLLDVTVGYGYRSWIAGVWLLILLAFGTVTFGIVHPHPLQPVGQQPKFNSLFYTLDLLVPVGGFGSKSAWDPAAWTLWLASSLTIAGWILATALIAGATRVLRPD